MNISNNLKIVLATLGAVLLIAVGLAVSGLVSAGNASAAAKQDSHQTTVREASQKASSDKTLAADNKQLAADNKEIASIQSTLASIGHAASTAHLGICVNYSAQSTDSNQDTYTYEDVSAATLLSGVASCPSGSFVSVVPADPPSGN